MSTPQITVFSPEGKMGTIPQHQLQDAGKAGYRVVMYDKSGARGSVPVDQMADATRSGYTTIAPTQFEKERQPQNQPGFWGTVKNDLKGMAAGAAEKVSENPFGLLNPLSYPGTPSEVKAGYEKEKQEGRSLPYRMIAGLGRVSGVAPVDQMEQDADIGNKRGIYGHSVLNAALAAAPIAGEYMGRGIGALDNVRGNIGEAIRTPEGKLKTLPKVMARVGGAAAGYATHIPEGGLIGAVTGPTLMESLFPDPNAELRARAAFMNRGYKPLAPEESGTMPRLGEGSAIKPFEPMIWESPEEAASHDFRMKNIERQASSAGKYHAAQGASGKRLNLQQRIGRKELP